MYSRRTMLRLGGVTTLVGLAGCAVPRADSGSRRRQAGVPAAGEPTYRQWLPAADATDDSSGLGSATVRYVDVDRAVERGETLPTTVAVSAFEFWSSGDWFGHESTDLEGILAFDTTPSTLVYAGDISTDDAADGLAESGYDSRETDEAWTPYVGEGRPWIVGVGDSGVVQTALPNRSDEAIDDGIDRLRAVFDANAGEIPRRHEDDPHLERLTDALGRGIRTTIGLERPAWLPEDGRWGTTVDATDGEYVRRASVSVPETDDEIDGAFADQFRDLWDEEPTVYTDDEVADAFATTTAAEPIGDVGDAIPPRTTIAFEYDEDDQRGEVSHLAGDALELPRLTITVDGLTGEELQFDEGTFEPGARFAVGGLPANVVVGFRYELESGLELPLDRFVAAESSTAPAEPPLEEPIDEGGE